MSENKTTEIAVLNDYPEKDYNLLVPVRTIQELSPLHKVVINQVQINPDVNKKEVYKEKNGELALTKKGLAKLMTAANIQIVESKTVTPQKCQRCTEIAGKTKVAPKCYECPFCDDVAHQVILAVPEASGTWRKVVGSKEIRMNDVQKTMTDKQFQAFYPFRSEQCETKALNRALREALMLNSTYKADDLKKPFAVAYIVPNMNDPELKKIVAAKYADGVASLFNSDVKAIEAPSNIPEEKVTIIPPDEVEQIENTHDEQDKNIQDTDYTEDKLICDECGEEITATEKASAEKIAEWTKETFKRQLCAECSMKENEKLKQKMGDK